jgi:hypothetical protein
VVELRMRCGVAELGCGGAEVWRSRVGVYRN